MLDYIRRQLQPQKSQPTSIKPEDVPDEAILEYAQLFQELDDLSVEGTDADRERSLGIDIPLEDDLEIETVEFNLNDGRISDVPGDATVVEGYEHVKSYDSFYEEAAEMVHRFPRESDASYDKRVRQVADKMYTEYCDESAELGLNGFGEINLSNDKIPSKANINFGPYMENGDTAFIGKLQVFFATDENHNISKKQLDSFKLVQEGAFANIGPSLKAYMESNYDVPEGSNVWDLASPQRLFVPRGNGDSFCVVLEYFNEISQKKEYFGWTKPTHIVQEDAKINKSKIDEDGIYKYFYNNYKVAANHPWIENHYGNVSGFYRDMRKNLLNSITPISNWLSKKTGATSIDVMAGPLGSKVQIEIDWRKDSESGQMILDITPDEKSADSDAPGYVKVKMSVRDTNGKRHSCTMNADLLKASGESSLVFNINQNLKHSVFKESFEISTGSDIDDMIRVNMESFVTAERYENHDIFVQESVSASRRERLSRRPLSRFVQEAIDFGGGDDGGDSTDAGTGDAGNDMPPTDDNAADNTGGSDTDVNTDNDTGNSTESNEGGDENKETAAVNNVSDAIAEKVADQTQADAVDSGDGDTNITFDDDTSDGSNTEADNEPSVDDQLDDLDSSLGGGYGTDTDADVDSTDDSMDSEGDEMSDGDDGEIDINNMTIDDLIEQGSEKLKGMTIEQIKNFISSNNPDAVQEAFILTSKNINKEIDVSLRKCLGTLNDNKMNIDKLVSKFKVNGRHLNRVLSKAAKMSKAFSTDEIESIKKLNQSLVNLMMSLKKSKDQSQVSTIKTNVAAFTSESKVVAKIVETKLANPKVKVQQEGFVQEGLFLSEKNVKKRLAAKIPPVFTDLSEISRLYDQGRLTKGKLIKMYKPKKTDYQTTVGGYTSADGGPGSISTTTVNKSYEIDTVEMANLEALLKIIGKILRKGKTHSAFTSDELQKIDDLGEALDAFVDYLESIIVDSSDNKSIIDQVGKDTKKLVEMLREVHNICAGLDPKKERRYDETENDPIKDNDSSDNDGENIMNEEIPTFDDDTDGDNNDGDDKSTDDTNDTDDGEEGEE